MSQRPTSRYDRQARYVPLGDDGQRQLGEARALVCGCGALGSVVAETLVRAGVGFVRIVDRDDRTLLRAAAWYSGGLMALVLVTGVALYMLPPLAFVIIVLSNYMRKGRTR